MGLVVYFSMVFMEMRIQAVVCTDEVAVAIGTRMLHIKWFTSVVQNVRMFRSSMYYFSSFGDV
jgi:virulence-associated protein VapD